MKKYVVGYLDNTLQLDGMYTEWTLGRFVN